MPQIIPCIWLDNQAEEAARFYTGIFKNSRINTVTRYGEAGQEIHGRQPGSVLTVDFELDGKAFTALNGGPIFKLSEAVSFQVMCDTQEELDYYWDRLTEGGDEQSQQCGWLKDKFGLSWQIVPKVLIELMTAGDAAGQDRMMDALLQMKKLDIAALKAAFEGK